MSVTDRFKNAFDSKNSEHVKWLAKFYKYAKNLASNREPIEKFINTNPMGVTMESSETLDWIHIHFILAMKYSQDVLDGKAWIPNA
jgi:hypothetical protein